MGGQLRLYGRFRELADLRSLPISRLGEMPRNPPGAASSGINAGGNGGRTVLLGELAQVRRELKQADSLAFVSRGGEAYQPVVTLEVTRMPGQDSLKVIDRLLAELARAKAAPDWPARLDYQIVFNDGEKIWAELSDLGGNVLQARSRSLSC